MFSVLQEKESEKQIMLFGEPSVCHFVSDDEHLYRECGRWGGGGGASANSRL